MNAMQAQPRAFRLARRALPSAAILASMVVLGCGLLTTDPSRVFVSITLDYPGQAYQGYLTVGDQDTVRATAGIITWPAKEVCDSATEPRCFTYSSSAPSVATVDAEGVVRTLRTGTTILRAAAKGAESIALRLAVVPRAAALQASPDAISATVGDTITVTITATDAVGALVDGVLFNLMPDTTYWAVTSPPAGNEWARATPVSLRLRANLVGSVRLTATALNERAARRLVSPAVGVRVVSP